MNFKGTLNSLIGSFRIFDLQVGGIMTYSKLLKTVDTQIRSKLYRRLNFDMNKIEYGTDYAPFDIIDEIIPEIISGNYDELIEEYIKNIDTMGISDTDIYNLLNARNKIGELNDILANLDIPPFTVRDKMDTSTKNRFFGIKIPCHIYERLSDVLGDASMVKPSGSRMYHGIREYGVSYTEFKIPYIDHYDTPSNIIMLCYIDSDYNIHIITFIVLEIDASGHETLFFDILSRKGIMLSYMENVASDSMRFRFIDFKIDKLLDLCCHIIYSNMFVLMLFNRQSDIHEKVNRLSMIQLYTLMIYTRKILPCDFPDELKYNPYARAHPMPYHPPLHPIDKMTEFRRDIKSIRTKSRPQFGIEHDISDRPILHGLRERTPKIPTKMITRRPPKILEEGEKEGIREVGVRVTGIEPARKREKEDPRGLRVMNMDFGEYKRRQREKAFDVGVGKYESFVDRRQGRLERSVHMRLHSPQ